MKQFIQHGKKAAIQCIAIFLIMMLLPLTGSRLVQTGQSIRLEGCSDGIVLNGTMGNDGWYISPVIITFQGFFSYFLKIDQGEWFQYTQPVIVTTEGQHTVLWYAVDNQGNQSPTYTEVFKIDMTPPTVTITQHRIGFFKILVRINASDTISGVVLIVFYCDDALIGFLTTPPYDFLMTIGLGKHTVEVIASDAAGNQESSFEISSYIPLIGKSNFCINRSVQPSIISSCILNYL